MTSLLTDNVITRTAMRMYRHFDTVPPAIAIEQYRFYIISNIGYTLGWLIHTAWLIIFAYLGQFTMMQIQVASIACHILAIILNRKGYLEAAMVVGMLEVVAHQVIAVGLLGWDAGFQYAAIAFFPYLKQDGSIVVKSLLVLACMVSYLYLDIAFKGALPVYILSEDAVSWFNYSNIILCFLFIATWGLFLTIAIRRTETVLLEKKQQLYAAEKAMEQAEMMRQLEVKERDMEIFRLRNVELKNSNDAIIAQNKLIEEEKRRSEALLLNILPEQTATELLREGHAKSHKYEAVTVMFTDFVNFTTIAAELRAEDLVQHIDEYFRAFDEITLKHGVEKIKTIGDAYMCAGGLPVENTTHAHDVLNAAMDIIRFMETNESRFFTIRIGVHTGPLVAGVVGKHKFQYDIWGDAVNIAARMEQNSLPGRINISGATYQLVKDKIECEYRGKILAKNKGELDMYFVGNANA